MDSETAMVPVQRNEISLGTLQASDSTQLVEGATAIADSLADIIKKNKLAVKISGREYVRCEGWTTLSALLGVVPREVSNHQQEDGSYIATVELVRMNDGAVISRASAECGMDEPTWSKRPRYARRSMAATRATGKAARLAFSWIMSLSGYEPTPFEEIPDEDRNGDAAAPKTYTETRYIGGEKREAVRSADGERDIDGEREELRQEVLSRCDGDENRAKEMLQSLTRADEGKGDFAGFKTVRGMKHGWQFDQAWKRLGEMDNASA